jgi:hypothetical protein
MRTTVDIPDALFIKAKTEAALRGIKLKDLFAAGIAKEIASRTATESTGHKRPPPVLISGVDWTFPNRTNADLLEAAEEDEEAGNG